MKSDDIRFSISYNIKSRGPKLHIQVQTPFNFIENRARELQSMTSHND